MDGRGSVSKEKKRIAGRLSGQYLTGFTWEATPSHVVSSIYVRKSDGRVRDVVQAEENLVNS